MRIDAFIIWGSGVPYLNEIMVTLRSKFEILMVHKHEIHDIAKFVDDIYACDSYPLAHLKEKTRYLLKIDPLCFLVLVKNHNVDEQLVGVEPYRKPQCMYLHEIKNGIRNKYNPSHTEHVIHGTDYESQVDHILKVFDLEPKEYYTRELSYPWPWHLRIPKSRIRIMISVDQLRVNILGQGLVHIKDSPHYKFVNGDRQPYEIYHKRYRGIELKADHFPENFDDMIKSNNYYEPIIIYGNRVLDGVHRLAILADNFYSIRAYSVNFPPIR